MGHGVPKVREEPVAQVLGNVSVEAGNHLGARLLVGPHQLAQLLGIELTYAYLRWFHRAAAVTLVSTIELERELDRRGFVRLAQWGRGVDTELFRPRSKAFLPGPRPIFMYVGRVAPEKNLDAFLSLELPGQKYVVGDGADLRRLRARYPDVRFAGARYGEDLACHFAAADVFVFPSRTDTFGLVLLEALASGVPVAAYPVAGPRQSVVHGETGILDEDLGRAALDALALDPGRCRTSALRFSWAESIAQLARHLETHQVGARPPMSKHGPAGPAPERPSPHGGDGRLLGHEELRPLAGRSVLGRNEDCSVC